MLRQRILSDYSAMKQKASVLLSGAPGRISLNFDNWTLCENDNFMALTSHRIANDWKLCMLTFDLVLLPSGTAGVILKEFVLDCLEKSKILGCTADGGGNMRT